MHDSSRDLLDEKVAEFIDTIDEGDIVNDEGSENIIGMLGYYLLPFGVPFHEFYLDELHYFCKCLVDSSLKSHTNPTTTDFSAYWGWTAALVSHSERTEVLDDYQDIIRDYYHLVHSALVSERHSRLIQENSELHMTISNLNPSLAEIVTDSGLPLAATFGFSVLEGLLKRRCNSLTRDTHTNIREGFQTLIQDPDVSPVVQEVIQEIDNLDRYDTDVLERKLSGIPDLSGRDSLLWLIKEQRNYNIHGEGSTQAVGSLVLTLCSLVLLDEFSNLNYQEAQEDILQNIHDRNMPMVRPNSPSAFYPVEII